MGAFFIGFSLTLVNRLANPFAPTPSFWKKKATAAKSAAADFSRPRATLQREVQFQLLLPKWGLIYQSQFILTLVNRSVEPVRNRVFHSRTRHLLALNDAVALKRFCPLQKLGFFSLIYQSQVIWGRQFVSKRGEFLLKYLDWKCGITCNNVSSIVQEGTPICYN